MIFEGEMKWINFDSKLAAILVLLLFVSSTIKAYQTEDGFYQCDHIVKKWASSTLESEVRKNKHVLQEMLFFLHVPRTGGRTYYHCFLKKLYPNPLECPRSYDKLRFNPRKQDCRLLVTHDDYTVISKLPKDKTSVVTILRDPIDRVFSAYEFSVEVAARFLVHPNLTSALSMTNRLRIRSKNRGVSTLDIWPWKYLVPWMREDLFARRDARKQKGQASTGSSDPYDMEDIVMPLHEYINDPIAQDIIHNGATFQIAGLTNNSYLAESHEVRHCVMKYQSLGKYVMEVAKKRLDDMLYVGLTENHRESAEIFADVVGTQVISQFSGSSSNRKVAANNIEEQSFPVPFSNNGTNYRVINETYQGPSKISAKSVGATNENMTAGKLIKDYESCISTLRKAQSERRRNSLKQIYPANFTKEARRQIPKVLLQEITTLNHLDVELYKYAREIFAKQQSNMVPIMVVADNLENMFSKPYGMPSGKVLYITLLSVLLLLLIFFFVNARRRTFKLKL